MNTCAYCDQPVEGNYSIHRDGFGVGPEVDLCDACAENDEIGCVDIWERIAQPANGEFAHRRRGDDADGALSDIAGAYR